jgi:hypothetical protein
MQTERWMHYHILTAEFPLGEFATNEEGGFLVTGGGGGNFTVRDLCTSSLEIPTL